MKKIYKNKYIMAMVGLFFAGPVVAQGTMTSNEMVFLFAAGFVFVVALLVLLVSVYLLQILKVFVNKESARIAEEKGVEIAEEPSFWDRFNKSFNKTVELEKEESILLDHDYDGIKELDHHLPPWFKLLFIGGVVFGVVYMFVYHVFGTLPLPSEELKNELAVANTAKQQTEEVIIDVNTLEASVDPAVLANGKKAFERQCASCHRTDLGGSIGPNLTDDHWINGGGVQNIFKTIRDGGRPGKGMIAWSSSMSASKMSDLASYIVSKQGSNPDNPKQAEGEVWIEEEAGAGNEPVAGEEEKPVVEEEPTPEN